jgi:hypothetical protein
LVEKNRHTFGGFMPHTDENRLGALFIFGRPQTVDQLMRIKKTALWIIQVPRVGDLICHKFNERINQTFEVIRVLWADMTDGHPIEYEMDWEDFYNPDGLTPEQSGWNISGTVEKYSYYEQLGKSHCRSHRSGGMDYDLLAIWRGDPIPPDVIIFTNEEPIKNDGILF